jgi:hypothetical protein
VLKTRYSYITCSKCGNARLPAATTSTSVPPPGAAAAVAAEEADAAADIDAGESVCPMHVQAVYRLRTNAAGYSLEKVGAIRGTHTITLVPLRAVITLVPIRKYSL